MTLMSSSESIMSQPKLAQMGLNGCKSAQMSLNKSKRA